MTYQWKLENLYPVSADVAGAELERLYKENGTVAAETLVEESRSPNAPLHKCFEWDDQKAAAAYRVTQAQGIIRALVTVPESTTVEPVRAFVSVQSQYTPIHVVLQSETLTKSMLQQALMELLAFQKKYKTIQALSGVFKAIEGVKEIAS